jgi:hypothetical protein
MAADWIIHGITENQISEIVSPKIIDDYSSILSNGVIKNETNSILTNYLKPSKIISGNFYLNKDKLLFQGTLTSGDINDVIIAFKPVECDSNSPLDCIEKLKQLILGYLITENNNVLNLQQAPPKFEAYQYLLDAKTNYDQSDKYLEYLNKAIEVDNNYFEAKVLRIGHYYNQQNYVKADSLIKEITLTGHSNNRQKNLLNMYQALLEGNNSNVYKFLMNEYNIAPFDIETNSSAMTVALQFINKPENVNDIYNAIGSNDVNLINCTYCEFRIYIKSLAEIELENYDEAISLLENVTGTINKLYLKEVLLTAYLRKGDLNKFENLLSKIELIESTANSEEWQELCLFLGKEFILLNKQKLAANLFEKVLNSNNITEAYATAVFYNNNFKDAQNYFKKLLLKNPNNPFILSKLATCQFKLNRKEELQNTLDKLEYLRASFQFGKIDYTLAQYYASISDDKNAVNYLLKSVAAGYSYTQNSFQNDPNFNFIKNTNEFKYILNFWH